MPELNHVSREMVTQQMMSAACLWLCAQHHWSPHWHTLLACIQESCRAKGLSGVHEAAFCPSSRIECLAALFKQTSKVMLRLFAHSLV